MTLELGFGTWGLGGDSYGSITDTEALNLLELAYEKGIRAFDTSPSYGNGRAESLLGKFHKKRKDIQLFTKIGMMPHNTYEIPHDFSTKNLCLSIEESLRRLNTEQLQLVQLQSPQLNYLKEYPDLVEDLVRLKATGKVGKVGISLRSPIHLDELLNDHSWESFQFNFSLLDQRILESKSISAQKFLGAIRIARTPLQFGFLTELGVDLNSLGPDRHLAKWPLQQLTAWQEAANQFKELASEVGVSLETLAFQYLKASKIPTIVIPGMMTPDQIIRNSSDHNSIPLDKVILERIEEIYSRNELNLRVVTPFNYVSRH